MLDFEDREMSGAGVTRANHESMKKKRTAWLQTSLQWVAAGRYDGKSGGLSGDGVLEGDGWLRSEVWRMEKGTTGDPWRGLVCAVYGEGSAGEVGLHLAQRISGQEWKEVFEGVVVGDCVVDRVMELAKREAVEDLEGADWEMAIDEWRTQRLRRESTGGREVGIEDVACWLRYAKVSRSRRNEVALGEGVSDWPVVVVLPDKESWERWRKIAAGGTLLLPLFMGDGPWPGNWNGDPLNKCAKPTWRVKKEGIPPLELAVALSYCGVANTDLAEVGSIVWEWGGSEGGRLWWDRVQRQWEEGKGLGLVARDWPSYAEPFVWDVFTDVVYEMILADGAPEFLEVDKD